MNTVFRGILLFLLTLVVAYFLGLYFGSVYLYFFPSIGGGLFIGLAGMALYLLGVVLAYIFFLTFLFTAFGDAKKYWWIGILLIPAALFELYFDWVHLYFPIAIGLVGWGLGLGVEKGLKMIKK
jgi:hypothetical protein